MTYVPGCNVDVFISYAHRDNVDGWVAKLKKKLAKKLDPFLADRAEVWFDDRIAPGVYFKDEIQQKLKNTAIFVAIVSPSYLKSEFSIIHELEWYLNHRGKDIIQLLKVPLEPDQQVPLSESAYEILYDKEDDHLLDGRALDRVLDDVVRAMTKKLREFWELRPKIYVAQVSNQDLKPLWDELKEHLHVLGYAILPSGVLPPHAPDNTIREKLERAGLSLHLEGVPDDPFAQRQLYIARKSGLPIIILPKPPRRDELSSVIVEVQRRFESNRKPAVYLIYDYYSDHRRVAPLPELIRQRTGCDVMVPEGGEKAHKFRLQMSDGVLLFRGDAPEDWLKAQEVPLVQVAAVRGRPAVEAKYLTRRPNGHPLGVNVTVGTRQEWIIERTGDPEVADLQNDLAPFFDAVRSRVQGAEGAV